MQSVSHLLTRMGRDREALDFLTEAESRLESGLVSAQLAAMQNELGHHADALRSLERYAELSVCLYLPDGRIACQFQRPDITSNERFNAGGLSYSVIEPLKKVSMTFDGELMIVNDPNALRDPKTLFANGPRLPGHVHWTLEAESPVHGGEPVNIS